MAKEPGVNFELPADMRAFVEKSVEQARQAFESFLTATKDAVNQAESRATSARAGAKDAVELAMQYSERNVAAAFEFAQRLLQAKDASEVATIHSEYVTSQLTALSDQAKELGKQASKMTGASN